MTAFDYLDVYYMSTRLTTQQIRESIYACEQAPDDGFPYDDLKDALKEALRMKAPNPTRKTFGKRINPEVVKGRNDIVCVVEQYARLRKSGNKFMGKCPIHDDKNPSMAVYPNTQSFYCFACGAKGDVISFVMAVENTDFRGAVSILGGG